MHLLGDKLLTGAIILVATLLTGAYPFYKRYKTKFARSFPMAEAFSCGIFLGVGLLHLFVESVAGFEEASLSWAYALFAALAVIGFMFSLDLFMQKKALHSVSMPLFIVLMLCLHAFFEGVALGLSQQIAVVYLVFFAIIIHKWAESFALSVVLTSKSNVSFKLGFLCFVIFSCMTPLGIVLGGFVNYSFSHQLWVKALCDAIAAGTFIYFGSAHTFSRGSDVCAEKISLRKFVYWLSGFALMAFISIWV